MVLKKSENLKRTKIKKKIPRYSNKILKNLKIQN